MQRFNLSVEAWGGSLTNVWGAGLGVWDFKTLIPLGTGWRKAGLQSSVGGAEPQANSSTRTLNFPKTHCSKAMMPRRRAPNHRFRW